MFCIVYILAAKAHHSDAVYDRSAIVAFEATVLRYEFSNPHVMLFVRTESENGQTIEWEIETGSTPIMIRSGWSQDLLTAGDTVDIRAHPMRSGEHKAILATLRTSDGRNWSQIEGEPTATARATSLAGVWQGEALTSLERQLRAHPLTPAGEAARRSYDAIADAPTARCIAMPPPFLNTSTNYLTGIEMLTDRIILRNEFFDMQRTVYMDGRSHPEDAERTNLGHSIGWWEDDVLVVDTTALADHRAGNGRAGIPSGAQKHVIERFSLSDDGSRAIVDVFIEDPEFLAEPFVGQTTMVYSPQLQLYSYDCKL
ncbi:MAG: DUF6152 family protein [Gammaproteobacteria bacterium]